MIRPLPDELLIARLLPLIDHPDPAVVAAAARAAAAAGAPCVEVGLRHPTSLDALRSAVESAPIPIGA
ncbi:MAG: ketohydroxyglutarate aldolase, partial [Acidobacteria bacterium]|nr:ketohydroxyglutarate aldolase [Acidobacteriota bacterium]